MSINDNTRTNRIESGITEEFLSFEMLLGAAARNRTGILQTVNFTNTGEARLYVASMTDATQPDSNNYTNTIEPGGVLKLPRVNLSRLYIKTADGAAANSVDFFGTPE